MNETMELREALKRVTVIERRMAALKKQVENRQEQIVALEDEARAIAKRWAKAKWTPCYACPKPDEGFPPCEVCGGEPEGGEE